MLQSYSCTSKMHNEFLLLFEWQLKLFQLLPPVASVNWKKNHSYIEVLKSTLTNITFNVLGVAGLDGNKLAHVWNTACHFYLSSLRRAVNSKLDRTFLGVCITKIVSVKEQAPWMLPILIVPFPHVNT